MPSLNIRRNDQVKVLTGADRGKVQRVLRVFPDKGTVLVEHVRVVKKTISSKTSRQRTKGGIAEHESPISVSNVAWFARTAAWPGWVTRSKATPR